MDFQNDNVKWLMRFWLEEYIHYGHPNCNTVEEKCRDLLKYVHNPLELATWYYCSSAACQTDFKARLKDVFLNSQENIKKVVFEYDQTIITYEELLNAIVENFNGITKQMLAPYLTEN